jgi:ubiquinone/menaquinone biosynthesis C-methylase UbiE
MAASTAARSGFYRRTLEKLLAQGEIARSMTVLVVAGGTEDRDALLSAGFENVTISNIDDEVADAFAPYAWSRQDAERLDYPDDSFDFAIVSAGLHHCASPHAALLEMYRVARSGLLAIESRDSFLIRLAIRLGVLEEYELTAVYANDLAYGGVRNSPVPNYVYRWTERELEKTIASYAPYARPRVRFFHEFELPSSVLDFRRSRMLAFALRALAPAASGLARAFPSQANLFAFAVLKPRLPAELFPWLRQDGDRVLPDESWLRSHLRGR